MIVRIGIENNLEGRTMAWALEHPGYFAYGKNADAAVENMLPSLGKYMDWIARHNRQPWLEPGEVEFEVEEVWDGYTLDQEYELAEAGVQGGFEVNAWFRHDWRPLSNEEVERGVKFLSWSRQDLLNLVKNLSPVALNAKFPGERWSIAGVLKHVGGAEWWYLDRLDLAFSQALLPKEPFQRMEMVRTRFLEVLPGMVGSRKVLGVDGEFWSPRKVLRRAVWHELDHIEHIQKLIKEVR